MNINKLHLVTPYYKRNIEGDIETKIYFFGVNLLEISNDVNTGEITSMIFNSKATDFNNENIISKLNEHLDKYNSQLEEVDYTKVGYLHIFGFDAITRTMESETEIYVTIGDNQYLVVYDANTANIKKIMENDNQIDIEKDTIDSLNEKFDKIRYEKYMNNKEKNDK